MARRVSLVLAFATVVGCTSATGLQSVPSQAEVTTVVGRLELVSKTYFRQPKFAVVDDNNHQVFVTPWAALEVPPSPKPTTGRVSTMRDYLGKRLAVTGIYRSARDFPRAAIAIAAPDVSFLDVTSVKDARGVEVFRGRPRFAAPQPDSKPGSENAKPGPSTEAAQPQATQPARPALPRTDIPGVSPPTTPPRLAAPPALKSTEPATAVPPRGAEPASRQTTAPAPTRPQAPMP